MTRIYCKKIVLDLHIPVRTDGAFQWNAIIRLSSGVDFGEWYGNLAPAALRDRLKRDFGQNISISFDEDEFAMLEASIPGLSFMPF